MCQDPPEYVTLPVVGSSQEQMMEVTLNGNTSECQYTVEQQKAYSLILYSDAATVHCKLVSDPQTGLIMLSGTEYSLLVKVLRRTSSGLTDYVSKSSRLWRRVQQVCEPMGREQDPQTWEAPLLFCSKTHKHKGSEFHDYSTCFTQNEKDLICCMWEKKIHESHKIFILTRHIHSKAGVSNSKEPGASAGVVVLPEGHVSLPMLGEKCTISENVVLFVSLIE